jgi:hypothetical protein
MVKWLHYDPLDEVLALNEMSEVAFRTAARDGVALAMPACVPHSGGAIFLVEPEAKVDDADCLIPEAAGYTGQGNFNYKVEVQNVAPDGRPHIKWSRDDVRAVIGCQGEGGLVLRGAPQDDQRMFRFGDCVEIRSARKVREGRMGRLTILTTSDHITYSLSADAMDRFDTLQAPVIITRWDHPHAEGDKGTPVPNGGLLLEKGLSVTLDGDFKPGDYWYCAVRQTTGQPIWPPQGGDASDPVPPVQLGSCLCAFGHRQTRWHDNHKWCDRSAS